MVVPSSSPGAAFATRSVAVPGPAMLRLLAVVSVGAIACAAVVRPADATHGPVVCPFRLLTGLPCPGCGMSRAWVFALHGNLRDALLANPFVLVTLPAAAALVLAVLGSAVRRRPPPRVHALLAHVLVRSLILGWIIFGVVRAVAVLGGRASV